MKPLPFMKPLHAPSISISNEPLLCLDFDGVLCDSLEECMLTAFNAYFGCAQHFPSQLPRRFAEFFRRYRYRVGPLCEYFLLVHAWHTQLDLATLFARKSIPQSFATDFLLARAALRKTPSLWLGLHRLYPQSACVCEDRFPEFFIVSHKDEVSINELARHHGYAHKLRGVRTREHWPEKSDAIRALLAQEKRDANTLVMVDDSARNLHALRPTGIRLRMATWGYCEPGRHPFTTVRHLSDFLTPHRKRVPS